MNQPPKWCQCWCFFGILGNPLWKGIRWICRSNHQPRPPLSFWSWDWLETKRIVPYCFVKGNWSLVIFFWYVPPLVLPFYQQKKFPRTISNSYHSHCRTAALFLRYQLLSVGHHVGFPTWPIGDLNSHSPHLREALHGQASPARDAPQGSEDWHMLIFQVNIRSLTSKFLTCLAILIQIPLTFLLPFDSLPVSLWFTQCHSDAPYCLTTPSTSWLPVALSMSSKESTVRATYLPTYLPGAALFTELKT